MNSHDILIDMDMPKEFPQSLSSSGSSPVSASHAANNTLLESGSYLSVNISFAYYFFLIFLEYGRRKPAEEGNSS